MTQPVEESGAATADDTGDPSDRGDRGDSEDTAEVKRAASRRKGRSSVPSWDEIMFGGSAKED